LQPIVENAVYHGLEQKNLEGNLYIKGWTDHNMVFIEISDDGKGMNDQKLQELRDSLLINEGDYDINSKKGIGLKNIQDRLRLSFGNRYTFQIESNEETGTIVTISLPFENFHSPEESLK